MLYGVGAVLALLLNVLGVPVLAFALGMFIPLQLNTPLLVGGAIAEVVSKKRAKDGEKAEEMVKKRNEKGTLIASGFIAGGALMGVVSAAIKFAGADWYLYTWADTPGAQIAGVVAYVALCAYFYVAAKRI